MLRHFGNVQEHVLYVRDVPSSEGIDFYVRRRVSMTTEVHYTSYSEARAHFKDLLDAAMKGRPATVQRDTDRAAVVDAERLRRFLVALNPARAEVVAEAGGWSMFIPGVSIAADGGSFEEAVGEMVDALREYAGDWTDHLADVPNHRDNWALVQLITLSNDDQLRDWLVGTQA